MSLRLSLDIPEECATEMREKLGISIEDSLGESCKKAIKSILLKTLKHLQEPGLEPEQSALLEECVLKNLNVEIINELIADVEKSKDEISLF